MRQRLLFYYGVGGCLYQLVDDKEQPVAFVSKLLSGPQEVLTEKKKDELIILMLHHETKIPDEAYVKIKRVHNDIVGHGEVKTTISQLAKGNTP